MFRHEWAPKRSQRMQIIKTKLYARAEAQADTLANTLDK